MNMATESDYTTTAERVAVPQNKVSKHINICEHEEFKCPLYTNVTYSIVLQKEERKQNDILFKPSKLALTYCYNSTLLCVHFNCLSSLHTALTLYINKHTYFATSCWL